ncbi:helix-turn-helix transcriptional regulator [Fodinicola acaciae]|uniref:helix-turn-helix transcriptional regulator n=1 Tax=Fodinicola acaciae TaxID=2681555 RepID=UPI0013CF9FB3|nr:AAA family ATPase [Fodinicola acaciae]
MAIRTGTGAFVGRREQLAAGTALLDDVRAGAGAAMLLVAGEAGIGKTRLLAEIREYASGTGTRVLTGGCPPASDYHVPYAPLVEAFQRLPSSAAIDQALAVMIGTGRDNPSLRVDPAARQQLFHLVTRTLGGLTAMTPVLLAVEDLHWADRSTLGLLAFAATQLRDRPLLIAGSYRDDELEPAHPTRRLLAELSCRERCTTITLPPLDRQDTAAQLAGLLPAPVDQRLVTAVFARSGGNPFLTEVLAPLGGGGPLPVAVHDLILRTANDLPSDSRAVLRTAAVAGAQVSHDLLAALHKDDDQLTTALRAAIDRHLLVPDANGYRFRHALIAEALYADLLPAERRRTHAQAATLLTAHPSWGEVSTAVRVAHHWRAAGRLPEALAAEIRAGQAAAAVHAHQEALESLERAIEHWPAVRDAERVAGMDRATLLSGAADLADLVGDGVRAIELMRQATDAVDAAREPKRAARLFALLAEHELCESHDDEAQAALDRAGELLAGTEADGDSAYVLSATAWAALRRELAEPAVTYGAQAVDLGRLTGDLTAEAVGHMALGFGLAERGRLDDGIAELRASVALLDGRTDVEARWPAYLYLAAALRTANQLDEAIAVAADGHTRARLCGLEQAYGSRLLDEAARAELLSGRFDRAAERVEAAYACGPTPYVARALDLTFAELALLRGDLAAGREALARVDVDGCLSSRRPAKIHRMLTVRVDYALRERRFADVRADLDAALALLPAQRLGQLLASGVRAEAELAAAARAMRDAPAEAEAARRIEDLLAHVPDLLDEPEQAAFAAVCRAEAGRPGWPAAVAGWRALARPWQVAYATWRLAEATISGDRDEAARLLRQAHRQAETLGAGPLVGDIRSTAQLHRVPLGEPSAEPAVPRARTDLTVRELEALRHLAVGRSNREIAHALFISPKTASVHVTNILRKLNVDRRAKAAQAARLLGLIDP